MNNHPIQPLVLDEHGTLRFKENKIVFYLLEECRKHGVGLNELYVMDFDVDDRQQFAQLIGYSLQGYGTLSYFSQAVFDTAKTMHEEEIRDEKDARIAHLEMQLFNIKAGLRSPVAQLFGICESDLGGSEV